jgi:hypothetical protein
MISHRNISLLRLLIAVWALIGIDPALAMQSSMFNALFGTPGWVLPGAAIDMNFAGGQYWGAQPGQLIVSRGSSESEVCNGALYAFAPNVAPITPCGIWSWESRTNLFLNSTAPVTQNITTVVGSTYTVSFYGTGTLTLSGAATQTMTGSAFPARTTYSFTASTTSLGVTVTSLLAMNYVQVELNPNLFASVASAATASSGSGGVNGTAVYTVTGGTCTTQPTLNVTWTSGALTVNSVANGGSCSVLPPSPATLTYASGTATGWTGATVNLTPTNNAASAFATGPILTSGSAATRAQSIVSKAFPWSGPLSEYVIATPQTPILPSTNQFFVDVNDGTNANRLTLYRALVSGQPQTASVTGGNSSVIFNVAPWAQYTQGRFASYLAGTSLTGSFNGAATTTGSQANGVPQIKYLDIGQQFNTLFPCNCVIARVAIGHQSFVGR